MREKEIMNLLNQYPNEHFIKLYCTFQDINRLYFVMTYAENGELLTYMQANPLNIGSVKKYTLQLVSALEHIHRLGIVHRDLKPENILLNEQMNILITDFGSAQIYPTQANQNKDSQQQKQQQQQQGSNLKATTASQADRRNSFVGTAQYVSPEMLKDRQASNKSDLWALGVIIYQMITNVMPFNAPNEYLIYQKIQSLDYNYPDDFDQSARDLVNCLVKIDPLERLGAKDNLQNGGEYTSVREHKFLHVPNGERPVTANAKGTEANKKVSADPDLADIDKLSPGLDEAQLLRLLTVG